MIYRISLFVSAGAPLLANQAALPNGYSPWLLRLRPDCQSPNTLVGTG